MLITFEGPDRYGKSTQAALLYERLSGMYDALLMSVPGPIQQHNLAVKTIAVLGQDIRPLALAYRGSPIVGGLLFLASFADTSEQIVRRFPDAMIICDRWVDSLMVYQGYGMAALRPVLQFANIAMPDVTILLDGDPAQVLIGREEKEEDAAVQSNDDAIVRARLQRYRELVAIDPARWIVVNAANDPVFVHEEIWNRLLEWRRVHS